jgi:hypothetical protein
MNTDFLLHSFATDRHSLSAVTCFTKEEEQALADYITLNDSLPGHLFTQRELPVFSLLEPTDALTLPPSDIRSSCVVLAALAYLATHSDEHEP